MPRYVGITCDIEKVKADLEVNEEFKVVINFEVANDGRPFGNMAEAFTWATYQPAAHHPNGEENGDGPWYGYLFDYKG